jgi:virulence-associated protein VagC
METTKTRWIDGVQSTRFVANEARVKRHSDRFILEPIVGKWRWLDAFDSPLDADFEAAALEASSTQNRPELDGLFT